MPWRAESRAIGSHRKSGVQIGVKNLSPVESSFPPCLSSCNSVIRPCKGRRKHKIFGKAAARCKDSKQELCAGETYLMKSASRT